jgi:hypothetical protein
VLPTEAAVGAGSKEILTALEFASAHTPFYTTALYQVFWVNPPRVPVCKVVKPAVPVISELFATKSTVDL